MASEVTHRAIRVGEIKRTLLMATLMTMLLLPGAYANGGNEEQNKSGLRDEGVGMYTDPSVASQVSTFTINPRLVSCGVSAGPGIISPPAPPQPASFAMLMYSTRLDSYQVDRKSKTIYAAGRMRSITKFGPVPPIEDVQHDFVAIAVDNNPHDRFDIHFKTPFWNTGNLLCTPSTVVKGGCRFGGELLRDMGDVVVGQGDGQGE